MIFGVDQLIVFIQQYGYIAFFLLAFFETTLVPVPSEVVLPFAGALIAINALNPFFLVIDVWAGNIAGNVTGFWLSYYVGIDVILKYGKKFGFKMESYIDAERWVKKYGVAFAFISELLPVVRSVTSIVCGAFKMNFKKFLVYTIVGFAIWSSVLMYFGFVLAGNWSVIANYISGSTIYIAIIAVIAFAAIARKYLLEILRKVI